MTPASVDVMSMDGLAKYLKISRFTFYKLAQLGGLPAQTATVDSGLTRA